MSHPSTEFGNQVIARIKTQHRPQLKNLDEMIFAQNRPQQKDLVEIAGKSNVGKSMLLMEIMSRTILPIEFGGKAANAVFLQTENDFHIFKFMAILDKHIKESGAMGNPVDVIMKSLEQITFVRCYSQEDLEMTIISLDGIFTSNAKYSILAIDSIGAFYWSQTSDIRPIRCETYIRKLIGQLKKITDKHGLVLVYTTISNIGARSIEPNEINHIIDHKIALSNPDGEYNVFEAFITTPALNENCIRKFSISSFGINWLET